MRRGNLLVQSIEDASRNKHRTGRFPRRGFAPPRNDMSGGALQQNDKLEFEYSNSHFLLDKGGEWEYTHIIK